MFRVTREIDFCYGHRLLDYDGKCRHLHGHNGRAVIVIESPKLDARGMVLDFNDIKRVVSQWIDDNLDHRMLLRRDDPAVPILREAWRAAVSTGCESDGGEYCQVDFRLHGEGGFPGHRNSALGNAAVFCHVSARLKSGASRHQADWIARKPICAIKQSGRTAVAATTRTVVPPWDVGVDLCVDYPCESKYRPAQLCRFGKF